MNKPALVLICSVLALSACQSNRDVRTNAALASENALFERRMLARAGFEPGESLVRNGIEVQRARYMIALLWEPSVEVRRTMDGATVTLNNLGHRVIAKISAKEWDDLATQSRDAFIPPDEHSYRIAYAAFIKKYAFCHSWTVIESTQGGTYQNIAASVCFRTIQSRSLAYADAIARLAVDHIPDCKPDQSIADVTDAVKSCASRLGPPTEEYKAIG